MFCGSRWPLVGSACLLSMLASRTAGAQAPTSSGTERTLRVGLFEPDESWADRIQSGALEAQAAWNRHGGVRGRSLELVRLPETAPWSDAGPQLARFIREHDLCALIGPSGSAAAHVAAQVATRMRVPIITLSADPTLTAAKDPWIFSAVPSDLQQARALLRQALSAPQGAAARLVVPPGRAGRTRLDALRKACAELGIDARETHDDPQVVLLWLDAAPAEAFLQESWQALKATPVLGSLRLHRREFLDSHARGVQAVAMPALGGAGPTLASSLGHDALHAIAQAAATRGTDRDSIRAGLADLALHSLKSGLERFDASGRRVGRMEIRSARSLGDALRAPASDRRATQCEPRVASATEAPCTELHHE